MDLSIGGISAKKLARKFGTPLYAYDGGVIRERCRELKRNFPNIDLFYACKANTNADVVRLIAREGFGMETVSPGEIRAAMKVGVPASRITFTAGSIGEGEIAWVAKRGIRMHLDSLTQVEVFGKRFPGRDISVRMNLRIGAGHHAHVVTGGPMSKFGIDISNIGKLRKLALKYGLHITGLHQHIGSNILEIPVFIRAMEALMETAFQFPNLSHLDFGGGFGIPYKPREKRLDIETLGRKVKTKTAVFTKKYGKRVKMSFEPGRYLVAEAGYLLVRVNDVKRNPSRTFIGVNSGFNHLIRPVLYGSYHKIVNLTAGGDRMKRVTVAGNICESGDLFALDRLIQDPKVGDVLAIKNAGAYGYVMSSDYNLRPRPEEILVFKREILW